MRLFDNPVRRLPLAVSLLLLVANGAAAHSVPLNKEALAACVDKQRSAACRYQGHHEDLYIGTCQYASDEKLICVRNKPIQSTASGQAVSEPASEQHKAHSR